MPKLITNAKEKSDKQIMNQDRLIDISPTDLYRENLMPNLKEYERGKINIAIHAHSDLDTRTGVCWGDYWVKLYLMKALEEHYGGRVSMNVKSSQADVIIYCFGSPFIKKVNFPFFYNPKSLNILWQYSHPEHMTKKELVKYDYAFVASRSWIDFLNSWGLNTEINPKPLYACTDLSPQPLPKVWEGDCPDILFIGNARGGSENGRKSVHWLNEIYNDYKINYNIYLYGAKWGRYKYMWSRKWYKGQYFPYSELPSAYGAAKVNLIDGHDSMRNEGFVSAKVFDTIASKGWVVMEYNDGVEEIFGDKVLMFKTKEEMYKKIEWSLDIKNLKKINKLKDELAEIAQSHSYKKVADRIFEQIERMV